MQGEMGRTSAATGSNVDMPVLLRNTGSADCVVEGFADVTVLDTHGAVLARAAGTAGRAPTSTTARRWRSSSNAASRRS